MSHFQLLFLDYKTKNVYDNGSAMQSSYQRKCILARCYSVRIDIRTESHVQLLLLLKQSILDMNVLYRLPRQNI